MNKFVFSIIIVFLTGISIGAAGSYFYSNSKSCKGKPVAGHGIELNKLIKINEDLEVMRLTDKCYLYTAWADIGKWGRIGSNGLVVVNGDKAFLIDSPTTEVQTVELAWWFDKNLNAEFETFVPGHWHGDCVGGLPWLNKQGRSRDVRIKQN